MGLNEKNIGMKTALLVFVLLTIVDLVTTLRFGDLVKYLEINPAYKFVGIVGIVLINIIIVVGVLWIYYRSKKIINRFIFLNLIVTLCAAKLIAVINNIKVGLDPPTIQQAIQVTTEMKTQAMVSFGYTIFIPYLIAIISFMLFQKDHKINFKEEIENV